MKTLWLCDEEIGNIGDLHFRASVETVAGEELAVVLYCWHAIDTDHISGHREIQHVLDIPWYEMDGFMDDRYHSAEFQFDESDVRWLLSEWDAEFGQETRAELAASKTHLEQAVRDYMRDDIERYFFPVNVYAVDEYEQVTVKRYRREGWAFRFAEQFIKADLNGLVMVDTGVNRFWNSTGHSFEGCW